MFKLETSEGPVASQRELVAAVAARSGLTVTIPVVDATDPAVMFPEQARVFGHSDGTFTVLTEGGLAFRLEEPVDLWILVTGC